VQTAVAITTAACGPAAEGGRRAFEHALLRELPALRRRAGLLARNGPAAEDLLQDTLERSLGRWGQFRPGSNLRHWLLTIMQHLFLDRCRGQQRRRWLPEETDVVCADSADAGAEEAPPPVWQRVRLAELPAMLQRLPAPMRDTARLVLLERRSYREVAAHLRIPTATVGSRVARARARLRALVEAGVGVVADRRCASGGGEAEHAPASSGWSDGIACGHGEQLCGDGRGVPG
jgi:RNA polymerase sigma-70 factor (ECF subfamily)